MASLVGQSLYILKHDENRRSLTAQRLDVDYDIQYVKPSTSLDIGEGRIRVSSCLDNQWRTQSANLIVRANLHCVEDSGPLTSQGGECFGSLMHSGRIFRCAFSFG